MRNPEANGQIIMDVPITTSHSVDRYRLNRFVEAQTGALGTQFANYDQALRELQSGQKQTHWMWYVFPQLRGLGTSEMSVRYGIESLDEARAYLQHPILGQRLRECVEVVRRNMKNPEWIFGPVDAGKFRSCLTLFQQASEPNSIFAQSVGLFGSDDLTIERLARQASTAQEAFAQHCNNDTFPRSEQRPKALARVIYVLEADGVVASTYKLMLTRGGGFSVQCFLQDESSRLLAELREARPRPSLLITGTLGHLDGSYPGLLVAKACKEIEPSLKVLLVTGHREGNLPWILARSPVAIDATIFKLRFKLDGLRRAVCSLIGEPTEQPEPTT